MKINSITPNKGYLHGTTIKRSASNVRECAQERDELKLNKDQINTTIKRDFDGRVSFKGAAPFLHTAANFASDNPLVAEALFAILVTCGLRPLTIMATAKTDEDKSKCSYQAAKSISSGLVGLATTALIGTPIAKATKAANKNGAFKMPEEMKEKSLEVVKKGVDALKQHADDMPEIAGVKIKDLVSGDKINLGVFKKVGKNAEKSFVKSISEKLPEAAKDIKKAVTEQHIVDNYARAGKNVADKMLQPIFMILRAKVTIALVPILLTALGLKKVSSKAKEAKQNSYRDIDTNIPQSKKEVFKDFLGVTTNASK